MRDNIWTLYRLHHSTHNRSVGQIYSSPFIKPQAVDITNSHGLKTFSIIFLIITQYTRQKGMEYRDAGRSMQLIAASVQLIAAFCS